MPKVLYRFGGVLIFLGAGLMAAALAFGVYNITESNRAAKDAGDALAELQQHLPDAPADGDSSGSQQDPVVQVPAYVQNPDMEMPVETIGKWDYVGTISIPALNLELPILNQYSDKGLKKAPCRYTGSAYKDNLILAGHNYTAHFGRLTRLAMGDTVIFTDMDRNQFHYQLVDREDLLPSQVTQMESGDWDLTLFTCTIGNQYRIAFRFDKITAVK